MTDAITAVRRALADTFARLAVHERLEVERRPVDSVERLTAVARLRAYQHAARIVSPLGDEPRASTDNVYTEWRVSHIKDGQRVAWSRAASREQAYAFLLLAAGDGPVELLIESRLVISWELDGVVPVDWPRYVGPWSAVEA